VDEQDAFGSTPLHRAAWQGEVAIVQLLLAWQASPSASRRVDGLKPLDLAASRLRGSLEGSSPPSGLSVERASFDRAGHEVVSLLRTANFIKKAGAQSSAMRVSLKSRSDVNDLSKVEDADVAAEVTTLDEQAKEPCHTVVNELSISSVSTCASERQLQSSACSMLELSSLLGKAPL